MTKKRQMVCLLPKELVKFNNQIQLNLIESVFVGLTISDFTSNMSTSLSSMTDSDEPDSRYSMDSSLSPPSKCLDPCLKYICTKPNYYTAAILIINVQLPEKKSIRDFVQRQKPSHS
jgi:hypothetical protein